MSECVVRMEMPQGCGDCRIAQFGYCGITHEPVADAYMGYPENRPKTCPIICQLPEGHGRMIDADALKAWFFRTYSNEESYCNMDVAKAIDKAPTIVPVERSET